MNGDLFTYSVMICGGAVYAFALALTEPNVRWAVAYAVAGAALAGIGSVVWRFSWQEPEEHKERG